MTDQTVVALIGAAGAAIASAFAWVTGRRRGAAEATEGLARADVLLSTEARAIASDLRAEAAIERADRRRLEDDVEKLRADLAAERKRSERLEARIEELERAMRKAGLTLPGDTPSGGTPIAGGKG